MKKKTKFIIAGSSVAVIAAAIGGTAILTSAAKQNEEVVDMPNTVAVERMDLANKVSLSGTVKSADINTVKCDLTNIKVKSVNVKVGDEVKKGDVIAVLDDSDLQEDLAEAELEYKNTETKNDISVSAADRDYESTMSSADKSIRDADKDIQDAQKDFDEANEEYQKIYKEYLDKLDEKNKAYDKFKPYEKKVKDYKKEEKEEKEKDYNAALAKMTELETALSEASEKLALTENNLKTANKTLADAREEVTKQKALRQEAAAKLYSTAAANAMAEIEMPDGSAAPSVDTAPVDLSSYDASVTAAEKLVKESDVMLKDAQIAYDNASKAYNTISKDYRKAVDEKNKAYDEYKKYITNDGTQKGIELEQKYNEACDKFDLKEKEYKEAKKTYEKALALLNDKKELRNDAVTKSDKDRADIEGTYATTKMTVDESTKTKKKEIKKIKENIEKCTIVAPADGIVTSLGVVEGETFMGGEAAVIQDCGNFIISANADQYEIPSIEKGMLTKITVGALGDCEMEGTLSFAAPTPETKDNQSGQSIEYPVESEISDPVQGLRLGMKAKLEIISEEKQGVLAVPDECIQINENGDYYVETVDEAGERSQIVVDYGIKTDYYSEIEGAGITEGMQVVMPEPEEEPGFDGMMIF